MITDTLVRQPPEIRLPAKGDSFTDPVFGTRITRLTDETGRESGSHNYGRAGYFSSDGSLFWHHTPDAGAVLLHTTTGEVHRANVPGSTDCSFDPIDPDTLWYFLGRHLMRYSVHTQASERVKAFGARLDSLGGSVDWISRDARYMVLNMAGVSRVWDRQADVLYAGAPLGRAGDGWVGISPDGAYVVAARGKRLPSGQPIRSYRIDHDAQALSERGVLCWSLGGGHGGLISATDGRTYLVVFESHSDPGIYAVDVSITQTATPSGLVKQRGDNRKILPLAWPDNDGHVAPVWRGPMQDWCFISVESPDPSPWRVYTDEIVMANVLTGEVRRLLHHRSVGSQAPGMYRRQPRPAATWDGSRIAFTSNMGDTSVANYTDLYTAVIGPSDAPPPPPPPSPTTHRVRLEIDGARYHGTLTLGGCP